MTTAKLPKPFTGRCQKCRRAVKKGTDYLTVILGDQEKHICQRCYDALVQKGEINPTDPAPYSEYR